MKWLQKMKYKIAVVGTLLMALCLMPKDAAPTAEAAQTGSIALSYKLQGVNFSLYEVGQVKSDGKITLTGDFKGYDIYLKASSAAQTLESYAERDKIKALASDETDQNYIAFFENLEPALYLVTGEEAESDGVIYTPSPMLVQIPSIIDGETCYDVSADVKHETRPTGQTVDLSVLKIWKDEEFEFVRPTEIEVQLLKDGEVYDTVKLSKDNNWKHQWNDLDGQYKWAVVEKDIPLRYLVDVQKDATTYVVTNTFNLDFPGGYEYLETETETETEYYETESDEYWEETEAPSAPTGQTEVNKLPQTGQLWWPVPILALLGMLFLILGVMRRNGDGYEE